MTSVFDEIRQEAAAKAAAKAEARAEARATKAVARATRAAKAEAKAAQESIALKFLRLGKLTLEEVAECSGLSMARVRKLAQTLG